jgi:hypothetical protein
MNKIKKYLLNNLQKQSLIRWGVPLLITSLFLILLKNASVMLSYSSIVGRRPIYLIFIGILMLVVICWRIALHKIRSHLLYRRLAFVPWGTLCIFVIGLLIMIELIYGLNYSTVNHLFFPLFSVLPISLSAIMWGISTNCPRKFFANLALSITSAFLALVMAEIIFRHILLKSEIPTTEQEFYDAFEKNWPHPISVEKAPNELRILGIADSFGTNGGKNNYHYLLESIIKQQNSFFSIVNISKSGYSLFEELAVLKKFGRRYNPDIVLHGFFIGNDISDVYRNLHEGSLFTYQNIPVQRPAGLPSYRPSNFLILQWISRYKTAMHDRWLHHAEQQNDSSVIGLSEERFLQIEANSIEACRKYALSSNERWKEVVAVLDNIRLEVEQIGAQYILVVHPDRFQVEEALLRQLQNAYALNLNNFDLKLPQKFLANYCETRKIPCIDLLPTFRDNSIREGLYRFRDTHYNERGNKLASEAIFDFLVQNKLIDSNQ